MSDQSPSGAQLLRQLEDPRRGVAIRKKLAARLDVSYSSRLRQNLRGLNGPHPGTGSDSFQGAMLGEDARLGCKGLAAFGGETSRPIPQRVLPFRLGMTHQENRRADLLHRFEARSSSRLRGCRTSVPRTM